MSAFRQNYKLKKTLFGLVGGLFFLWVAIDAEFFNLAIPAGLREEGPWFFWIIVAGGALAASGAVWQLIHPPLVMAADSSGITVGFTNHARAINVSIRHFSVKRQGERDPCVPWKNVRSIGVGEVVYKSGGSSATTREPALRLEFDDSVDLSGCGDMLAIQSGTKAYFAAVSQKKHIGWLRWKEPPGRPRNENVVLIGEQHFDEHVHQVCDRLQKLASQYSKASIYDPPPVSPRSSEGSDKDFS